MAAMAAMERCERARAKKVGVPIVPSKACESESKLHDQIIQECRRRGYYVVHSRLDKKSTNGIGTPDFVLALPYGKTLWIECKKKGNKMTTEQAAAQAWLKRLGHIAVTVWSFSDFIVVLKDAGL